MIRFIFAFVVVFNSVKINASSQVALSSPSGILNVQIDVSNGLQYQVSMHDELVIRPSKLGFKLNRPNKVKLDFFKVNGQEMIEVNDSWKPVFGEYEQVKNNYREVKLILETLSEPAYKVDLIFRAYDDGIAFKYHFPLQENMKHFIVGDELSEFNFLEDHQLFWIPGDYETNEYLYNHSRISEIQALAASLEERDIALKEPIGDNFVQTPLLLQVKSGKWALIHEAALIDFPVMQLEVDREGFGFKAHLVPDAVGNKAYFETFNSTPWRAIILADTPEKLLDSQLILNLNDPNKLEDTSWLKTQKFIGVWWEMHIGKGTWEYERSTHAANTENVKKYIDFASKYGIDGVLVEGWNEGWEDWFGNWKEEVFDFVTPYPDYDIMHLSDYAASKNVKLIMHHETSGSVTNYERRMQSAFDFMNQHGIETVKTGYVGKIIPRGERHDSQWMNNHYIRVVEKAAENKIMVISHESSRPTGLHRTYPNWLASEAARGNEFNNAPTLGLVPEHESILAFTRLKGGPMDYTPGFFRFELNDFVSERTTRVNTTIAKQVANFVIFYSPIHMIGDLPENLEQYPELLEFIVDIPMNWKHTIHLKAFPGDYVVLAREDFEGNWYLAGISDEEERSFDLSLDFLDYSKKYFAILVEDGENASYQSNPTSHQIKFKKDVGSNFKVKMGSGGGFVIKISPIN